jgi:aldehyde dehydrogenase (NAD+)
MTFDYVPAPESVAIAGLQDEYGLFVDGTFREGDGSFPTVNPATGEVLAQVAVAGPAAVDAAVAAARTAYTEVWGPMPATHRAKYLYRLARLIGQRTRELAVLEACDTGRPIRHIRAFDLPFAERCFFYNAGWADKLQFASPTRARLGSGDPAPVGVAAQILTWTAPLVAVAGKLATALACGNTVVVKPSATTPLTALALARLCQEAELPPGVVNVLTGDDETGRLLVEHPGVDAVAFVGSTTTGKAVARAVARTGDRLAARARRRLTLELDAISTTIVLDDAAMEDAVEGLIESAFFGTSDGRQTRALLLAQESCAEELLGTLRQRMAQLRVGDPLDAGTDVGAVSSGELLDRLLTMTSCDSDDTERFSPQGHLPDQGFWFPPTVFTGVTLAHRLVREGTVGPLLPVLTFRTPSEAVELANNTPCGLAAAVWSASGSRSLAIASRLRAGTVMINAQPEFDAAAPCSGYKESGYGARGGRPGLEAYLA